MILRSCVINWYQLNCSSLPADDLSELNVVLLNIRYIESGKQPSDVKLPCIEFLLFSLGTKYGLRCSHWNHFHHSVVSNEKLGNFHESEELCYVAKSVESIVALKSKKFENFL